MSACQPIQVPIDGSARSTRGFDPAIAFDLPLGASLRLLHVIVTA
jgi:nucleotide-binding universal stress UspA family protein